MKTSRLALLGLLIALLGAALGRPACAQSTPIEITELARALKHDPDLIYEYVYNNIETLPQYGSLKGPLGALLDGKGTAFDLAELMVTLLRESGITASYLTGKINVTASQLTNWLGVDNVLGSVSYGLGSGGFPTDLHGFGTTVTSADIGWAWVKATIGGTDYVFDPSSKVYAQVAGISLSSLASATGYNQSSFISSGLSGATVTTTSITNLNRTNVRSNLTTYATNLVQYLRSNYPSASTADIIGGKTIVPLVLGTQVRQTSLPYAAGTPTTHTDIPDMNRAKLTLQFGSNDTGSNFTPLSSPVTLYSSDTYGHRIVVSFDGAGVASLLIDGTSQMTASGTVPSGRKLTIRTTVTHPYPSSFADQPVSDTMRVKPVDNFLYVISTGWGLVGRGMIERHRRVQQENIAANPGNPNAEPVFGETLAVIGYTWLAERARYVQIVDQLTATGTSRGTNTYYHHSVGIVGITGAGGSTGPYVDLPFNSMSTAQRIARPNTIDNQPIEAAAVMAHCFLASAAESGVLDQTQPGHTAASTVKVLDLVAQAGGQVFDINNPDVPGDDGTYYSATIRPVLQLTYTPADLAVIDSFVDPARNFRVIAPANGAVTLNDFTGTAYYTLNFSTTAAQFGSLITGGLSGGISSLPIPNDIIVDNTVFTVWPATASPITIVRGATGSTGDAGGSVNLTPASQEPVNLVSGDYFANTTDLTTGSTGLPFGLAFQRYYDSGTRLQNSTMGAGWTHNFAIDARADSDPYEGLGVGSPVNGATAIAATLVMVDLLNTSTMRPGLDRMLIVNVATAWLMEELTTNVVVIHQPGYLEHFVKLAGGTYNAPPGSAASLTFNGTAYTYVAGDRTTLSFNADGTLASWQSPAGAAMTLAYSGSPSLLASVTNTLGRSLTFTYAAGLVSQVTDDTGRSVSFAYDSAGNLARFVDTLGQTTTYAYDLPGRLTQIFYPATPGQPFVTNLYDGLGRVKTQTGINGGAWQYFLAGARTEEVDALGTRHVLYFTDRGRTRTEVQDWQGPTQTVSTSVWDAHNRLSLATAPEGNTVGYTYDLASNPLTVTRTAKPGSGLSPLVTTATWDATYNKPLTVTDPRGLVTTMTYDAATGNLLSVVADSATIKSTTRYGYNAVGQPLTAIDPMGVITQNSYDASGNLLSTVRDVGPSHLNLTTSWTWNARGDPLTVTDPKGNVATSTYDAGRRVLTTTTPATAAAPAGIVTAFTYDPAGRVTQTRQSSLGTVLRTTSATYTLSGQPATATDANGNITRFAYDLLDRRIKVTDPIGRITSFTYDALSRPTATYNTAIQSGPLLQQTYTGNGQRAALTDANSNTTGFAYDGFDRLATTTYPNTKTETYAYDADSNVTSRCTRLGQPIAFTYDTLNRLSTKTLPGTAATCGATPSGTVVNYTYDRAGRQTGVSDTSASIASPAATSTVFSTTYAYDTINRLTGVSFDPAPTPTLPSTAASIIFTHGYNGANQRSSLAVTDNAWINYPAGSASTTNYTVNTLNQYTAVGGASPAYDDNGNLTDDGSTYKFEYDAENRLTKSKTSGGSTIGTYTFDGRGRRTSKAVSGTTTIFVTAADNREVLEYDGATGAIQRWYAYGLGPNAVLGQMNVASSTRSTPVPDLIGSIIGTIDASNGTLTIFAYRPYGSSSSAPTPFAYTGQRIDTEVGGLHYYRARQYSAAWGRFLQADPVGYAAGVLLYAYVSNDPLNLVDPFGRNAEGTNSFASNWGENYNPFLDVDIMGNPLTFRYPGSQTGAVIAGTAVGLAAIVGIGGAAIGPAEITLLAQRAETVRRVLDPIAYGRRTVAALSTDAETIIGGGARDLIPAQRAALQTGERAAKLTGEHAEITVLTAAQEAGLVPRLLATTRTICPACASYIESIGGRLTSETTAIFPPP